ncbi:hypothetical protein L1887_15779 [Cichorium endivia]|nr:hypothetical protein L1887_15779 [Cichorium endivia]
MCIKQLYTIYGVPLPATVDDIPLKMPQIKGYSPRSDLVFGVVRRLPKAFLNLGDPRSIYVTKHLTVTENGEPYPPRSLKDEFQPKKGKKRAAEAPPSKQPKSNRPKKTADLSNVLFPYILLGSFMTPSQRRKTELADKRGRK